MTRPTIASILEIPANMKRIKKISVTLTRRRVTRIETPATGEPKTGPNPPEDVPEPKQAPPTSPDRLRAKPP